MDAFSLDTAARQIAQVTQLPAKSVLGAARLLDEGQTLPFIARYRKEQTGNLDERQLRLVEDGLSDAKELHQRKSTILASLDRLEIHDETLRAAIVHCEDKTRLEELYAPHKPSRATRADKARQRGLAPLAEALLNPRPPTQGKQPLLQSYVDPARDVADTEAALAGARDILAEQWANHPDVRQELRHARLRLELLSKAKRGWKEKQSKFEMYYDHHEPFARVPSHRFLAMRRGESEGVLALSLDWDHDHAKDLFARHVLPPGQPFWADQLQQAFDDSYQRLLVPGLTSHWMAEKLAEAETEAIEVFAENLKQLLLAPPLGSAVVIGLDPGFRTGTKAVVIDATGKLLDHTTLFVTPPKPQEDKARQLLDHWVDRFNAQWIALGNGTASRETDAFLTHWLAQRTGAKPGKITVNEAGASVYSASELAGQEFPDLDLTVRGAISIARRLQDPLAELVKIDPKSIGVGQYQHDVNQPKLKKALEREVISCVNQVGVNVNTASPSLLSYVAGIGPKLAEAVCQFREENGPFSKRQAITKVPRFGAKAFEQSAGFLRIPDGPNPLDASAVHPERYALVKTIAQSINLSPEKLIGNSSALAQLSLSHFVDESVGLPTLKDIVAELEKPGRDPRAPFQAAEFDDAVNEMADLAPGMMLQGVVTNVTRFGAFVDIGVHQDGLIHISELANHYVADPSHEVQVGQVVNVKVLDIDLDRKRIGLSRKQAN